MTLGENPSGISFDIEWTATMNPHEEEHDFRRSNGSVVQDISRFDQVGRARGHLQIPGESVTMTESNWWGHRDRSWGTRRPLRTDSAASQQTTFAPFLFSWSVAQFSNYALHWRFVERKAGRYSYLTGEVARPLEQKTEPGWMLESTEQEFRWDPAAVVQTLKGGEIDLFFENGEKRHVSFVTHPPRWHLKGGGYGGYRGWQQGDHRGEYSERPGDPARGEHAQRSSDRMAMR